MPPTFRQPAAVRGGAAQRQKRAASRRESGVTFDQSPCPPARCALFVETSGSRYIPPWSWALCPSSCRPSQRGGTAGAILSLVLDGPFSGRALGSPVEAFLFWRMGSPGNVARPLAASSLLGNDHDRRRVALPPAGARHPVGRTICHPREPRAQHGSSSGLCPTPRRPFGDLLEHPIAQLAGCGLCSAELRSELRVAWGRRLSSWLGGQLIDTR
jgi:hypothetical protein